MSDKENTPPKDENEMCDDTFLNVGRGEIEFLDNNYDLKFVEKNNEITGE